jgi:hypothetical protein
VEVLGAGAEPRQKLEIGRWTGLTYQLTSQRDGSFGLSGKTPIKTPTSIMESHFEVLRGTADPIEREIEGRQLRLIEERAVVERIEVQSATMPPEALAQLNAAFGLLKGLTTRSLVGEDGELVELKTESVGGVKPPPEIKKLLDGALDAQRHFPFRLPPVPVGVGARWRFSGPFEVRGVKATQVADMTLLELGEGTARISIRTRHTAPKQEVPHPTEPGLRATLDALRGDSDGELTIDRLTAYVIAARLTSTSFLTMTWMDPTGQDQHATFMQAEVQRMTGHVGSQPEGGTEDAGKDGSALEASASEAASADATSGAP